MNPADGDVDQAWADYENSNRRPNRATTYPAPPRPTPAAVRRPAPAAQPTTPPRPVTVGRLPAPGAGSSYITVIPAGDLFIDHTYQRPLDQARVDKMAAGYDVTLVGVLEVSARPDNRYAIVDGQHRWAMLRSLDSRGANTPICCHVHVGLTVGQEAALFRDIDRGRRALTTWDKWHARSAAGEPLVRAIENTIRERQLRIGTKGATGQIRATKACEEIVALGGTKLLGETLDAIVAAWGRGTESFGFELLVGVALLRAGHGGVDMGRLARELARTTPQQVGARARALRETERGTLGRLAAVHMAGLYNRAPGPKLGALPDQAYFNGLKKRKQADV